MDVIEELKFFGKFTKKKSRGREGSDGRVGCGGVGLDVNEELKFL